MQMSFLYELLDDILEGPYYSFILTIFESEHPLFT